MKMTPTYRSFALISTFLLAISLISGCGAAGGNVNLANSTTSNSNANMNANSTIANANSNSSSGIATTVESREPDAYQATVTLKVEAVGDQNATQMPTLAAKVARSGDDRRMEFTMPAGGRVIFLDKGGKNYLIMPEMNQYAELTKESLGFDVRRLLMPEQMVAQVKGMNGMQLVGDDTYNGRPVTKYKYAAVANTQTQAGQVATDSFMMIDKATGLPLHTETMSQSQSGGNVQGYKGFRVVTEMTDLSTTPAADQFAEPTGLKKIESEQVKAQVNMIFNALASLVGQMIKQGQPAASPSPQANK
jgi:hypothetical protein